MAVMTPGISDVSDRYINQPEKGPSFHTNEFMRGYNDGYDDCSGSAVTIQVSQEMTHVIIME